MMVRLLKNVRQPVMIRLIVKATYIKRIKNAQLSPRRVLKLKEMIQQMSSVTLLISQLRLTRKNTRNLLVHAKSILVKLLQLRYLQVLMLLLKHVKKNVMLMINATVSSTLMMQPIQSALHSNMKLQVMPLLVKLNAMQFNLTLLNMKIRSLVNVR